MLTVKVLLWTSLCILLYSYIGYGLLVYCLLKIKKIFGTASSNVQGELFTPDVTLLVAAYNEEDFIETKIENTLQLNYPQSKLQIIFITDGSSDRTPDIISKYGRIRLLHEPQRKGKIAAINRAMPLVETPYVIFCDANTLLNEDCINEIVKFYVDSKVGGVAGEKRILDIAGAKAAGAGEGLYWKYESFLKKLDSDFFTVVGAAGELFSIRTDLYPHQPDNIILDDFMISLQICMKGYRIKYEPKAYALEAPAAFIKEEQKRKIRISAGGFQSIVLLKSLLNPIKYPVLAFQYISHRVLRWTVCPLCLLIMFICGIILYNNNAGPVYSMLFYLQVLFYALAITGLLLANNNIKVKILYVPYYFFFMNVSLVLGFFRYIRKEQSVLWEKAARQSIS